MSTKLGAIVVGAALALGVLALGTPARADERTASAPSAPAAPPDEAAKQRSDNETRVVASLEVDHAFHRLYDLALQTTGARLGVGVQGAQASALVIADFGVGTLGASNLRATSGSLGVEAMIRALPFLRLGGGPRLGYLNVSRVTSGSPMEAFSIGVFASAKIDLYDFGPRDDHGVFMGARFDADLYGGNGAGSPLVWGPELFAGFRY